MINIKNETILSYFVSKGGQMFFSVPLNVLFYFLKLLEVEFDIALPFLRKNKTIYYYLAVISS